MLHFNHNNRSRRKNPFLGEEFVLWRENNSGADAQQSASADDEKAAKEERLKMGKYLNNDEFVKAHRVTPDTLYNLDDTDQFTEDNEFIRDLDKIIPGKTSYDPGDMSSHDKVRAQWNHTVRELKGQSSFISQFERTRDFVLGPEFDEKDPRWQARFRKIFASYENLIHEASFKDNKPLVQELMAKAKQEKDYTRGEIVASLNKAIKAIAIQRGQGMNSFHGQVQKDFDARLDFLNEQWKARPPKAYEGVADAFQKHIGEARKKIKGLKPVLDTDPAFEKGEEAIAEYFYIWDDLDRMEDKYRYAFESTAENFSVEHLDSRLNQAEDKRKAEIEPIAAAYNAQVEVAIREMKELIAMSPEGGRKGLQQTLKKLEESRDVGKMFKEGLDSDKPWTNEKDEAITWDNVEKNYSPKKGLKQQIEMLKRLPLNEAESRTLALGINDAFDRYEKGIETLVEDNTNKLPSLIKRIRLQKEAMDPGQASGDTWKWTVVSPLDIKRFGEIISEWAPRRYQRASNQRVGEFGSALLGPLADGPIPPLRSLPNEFDKEIEKAEAEEVNNYKEVYENKDMWEVEELAFKTRNVDEFKACLYLLAENGRLRWDKTALIRQVNRFQNRVFIPEDYATNLSDISTFYDRMNEAIGNIWDFDTYKELKTKNSSAYDSKKKEYEQSCHQWAEQPGGLNKVINGLIKQLADNPNAKVDPLLFEQIIDYAIVAGKMNPADKLHYLIKGIAIGILPPDRGSVLCSLRINDYPVIDYFGSGTDRSDKPTLQDIREIAELDDEAYIRWFHTHAMTLPRVTQRIDKTLTQGNRLDHDDLTPFLGYMAAATTENVLKEHSGSYILPSTGVQNATVGMMYFLDNISETYDEMPSSANQLQRFVDSVMRFNGIIKNHMYKDRAGYYRIDSTTLSDSPRNSSLYEAQFGRDLGTSQFLDTMGGYFEMLDADFFGSLYRGEIKTGEQAQELAKELKKKYNGDDIFNGAEVKNVDDLYKATGDFMEYLTRRQPNKVRNMFQALKAEHSKHWNGMEDKDKRLPEILKKSKQKVLALRETYNNGSENDVLEKYAADGFT